MRNHARCAGANIVCKPVRFRKSPSFFGFLIAALTCSFAVTAIGAQQPPKVTVNWEKVTGVSSTTPTLQVVVNPPLRPGEPLSTASYKAVKELGADYVRYVPW